MMYVEHYYKGNCYNAGLLKGLHPCLTKAVLRVTLDFKNTFTIGLNMAHLEPNMLTDIKL